MVLYTRPGLPRQPLRVMHGTGWLSADKVRLDVLIPHSLLSMLSIKMVLLAISMTERLAGAISNILAVLVTGTLGLNACDATMKAYSPSDHINL